jgi:hypothetical protein
MLVAPPTLVAPSAPVAPPVLVAPSTVLRVVFTPLPLLLQAAKPAAKPTLANVARSMPNPRLCRISLLHE